jgi:signal transduction histidine kinase
MRRLLDAILMVGSELHVQAVLQRIVEASTELVGARYGALGVLDEQRVRLVGFHTAGLTDDERAAIGAEPKGLGVLGHLIADPRPLRLSNLNSHSGSSGFPPNHPPMTTFLGVPVVVRGLAYGNLYLTDKLGGLEFTEADEDLMVMMASAAGIAIENARLHEQVADLATSADRERIARELHDSVIQRLFATGLGLQSAVRLSNDPDITARLQSAVDDLDATVREIRSVIFELHTQRLLGDSLRREVLAVCSESARILGFDPVVRFDGPIDSAVDTVVGEHLLAVTREALSNVARHASASLAVVSLSVADGEVTLTVSDDGIGPLSRQDGGQGLNNMGSRALDVGGRFEFGTAADGGSELRWSANAVLS